MTVLSNIGNLHTLSDTTVTQTFGDLVVTLPDVAWICLTAIVIALILKPVLLLIVREYQKAHSCYCKFAALEDRLKKGGL